VISAERSEAESPGARQPALRCGGREVVTRLGAVQWRSQSKLVPCEDAPVPSDATELKLARAKKENKGRKKSCTIKKQSQCGCVITGIIGKPRAGKSYYLVQRICDELAHGSRIVVTNLPLKQGEIAAYCARVNPGRDCRVLDRLRVIEDSREVTGEFWRFRGPVWDADGTLLEWLTLPRPDKEGRVDVRRMVPGDGSEAEKARARSHSCLYVIDEIYNYYNTRDWQSIGRGALWYMAQHAKYGDDCLLATHQIADIDKQLKARFQSWLYLQNNSLLNYANIFRGARTITWREYPSEMGRNTPINRSGTMRVDPDGVGKCYETDAGVGVPSGMGADKGRAAKGLPLWTVWVAAVVLGLTSWFPLGLGCVPTVFRPDERSPFGREP